MTWRDHLPIHPAAEMFPLMAEYDPAAFKELVDDIKVKGLIEPIGLWNGDGQPSLLDGRNRLDALEALGLLYVTEDHHLGIKKWTGQQWSDRRDALIEFAGHTRSYSNGDPYKIALSLNLHRRHLDAEQKRDVIAKYDKANPGKSIRQAAADLGLPKSTVGDARSGVRNRTPEAGVPAGTGEPETVTGRDGKKYKTRARKPPKQKTKSMMQAEAMLDSSEKGLAEFKTACDRCLPKLTPRDLEAAFRYSQEACRKLRGRADRTTGSLFDRAHDEVAP